MSVEHNKPTAVQTGTPEKDSSIQVPPIWRKRAAILRIILMALLALIAGSVLFWIGLPRREDPLFSLATELGKTLVGTALITTAIGWFLDSQRKLLDADAQEEQEIREQHFRQTVNSQLTRMRQEITDQTAGIRAEVLARTTQIREEVIQQTREIADRAVCFDALQTADVSKFYSTRGQASSDIKDALMQPGISELRLMGISLNDLLRDENSDLNTAWSRLREYVLRDEPPPRANHLKIKMMIVDPISEGAYLRSHAEGRVDKPSRLDDDVRSAMRDLTPLAELSQETGRRVTLEAKVYRTGPILFLVWTPHTVFTQPYHFRPRHSRARIPVIRYYNSDDENCLHKELAFHFDWIWENVAVSVRDAGERFCVGTARAVREAHIENMYLDYSISRCRIVDLIRRTKEILWIKGISLHSYFTDTESDPGRDLSGALTDAYNREVDVRVLLMDPDCEQAQLRSFREHLLSNEDATLPRFDMKKREEERLYTDTQASIRFIRRQLTNRVSAGTPLNVKLYRSAPDCFTLITDEVVFVEQYTYGTLSSAPGQQGPGAILGGDVPVIEYKRPGIQPQEPPELRLPEPAGNDVYGLFKDSFEYVYDHCSTELSL